MKKDRVQNQTVGALGGFLKTFASKKGAAMTRKIKKSNPMSNRTNVGNEMIDLFKA